VIIIALLLLPGLVLPLPSVALAWWALFQASATPPEKQWRRVMSLVGLTAITLGLALAIYVIEVNWRAGWRLSELPVPYYPKWAMSLGAWGAVGGVAISCASEGKIRKFLILGAVGLLFFFTCSVGEAI
jgi:hypothetical protein